MKIITLWQPWASLIALGLKNFETRSWSTAYRGPLLIHAAKRPFYSPKKRTSEYLIWLDALRIANEAEVLKNQSTIPFAEQLPLGAVVAIVDLVDCQLMRVIDAPTGSNPIWIDDQSVLERTVGDWRVGRYAWRLENPRALKPIPWTGGQGLRNTPTDLVSLVEQQLQPACDRI